MRVVFDPNATPVQLAQAAVMLLHRMRDVLLPTADCAAAMRSINDALELHAVFRQTLDKIPADFMAVTRSGVIRRDNLVESGKLALDGIKALRRSIRERCRDQFKYESGMDGHMGPRA